MGGVTIASMIGIDIARNEEEANSKYRVKYTGGWPSVTHNIGEVVSDTKSKEDINAIYGELKYSLTKDFTTTLNARYDNINYDYTNNLTSNDWKTDYNEVSYRVGATYSIAPKQTIFANISTGFRVPTISQMYAGDMSTSTYSGTYYNNTDIDTEKHIIMKSDIDIKRVYSLMKYLFFNLIEKMSLVEVVVTTHQLKA